MGVIVVVFPAYAGMSPWFDSSRYSFVCFPRLRGDEPSSLVSSCRVLEFSPPTRG